MKKIFLFAAILWSLGSQSQTDGDRYPKIDWMFRGNYLYPFAFGDNALAQAHRSKIGWGFEAGLIEFRQWKLFMGYNYSPYPITNKTLIGNIEKSNYSSLYGAISHEFPVSGKFSVVPDGGIGSARLALRTSQRRFGHQSGIDFRIGGRAVYDLSDTFGIYVGVHFIQTKFKVKTNAEYEKFFGNASQLQFAVGLQID